MNRTHRYLFAALLAALLISTLAVSAMGNTDREVRERLGTYDYLVIDLSAGPEAEHYPVSFLLDVPSGGWTDEHKRTKLVMRRIPAGTFMMGSPEDELGRSGDERQREVTLTKDFYIGIFHVTFRQWKQVMGDWDFGILRRASDADADMRPAQHVSVYEIRENAQDNRSIWPNWPQSSEAHPESFVGKLRAKTGLSTFDLPTEAQFEYAARAGTTTALSSGKNLTDREKCPNVAELARYRNNTPEGERMSTVKVGLYPPNPWGLYDMHGNMYDWCLDWYEGFHPQTMDPVGPCTGTERVRRGGCYNRRAANSRSAFRNADVPDNPGNYGFRLCMTLPTLAASAMGNTDPEVQERPEPYDYLVIDLSGGPEAESYPVSFLSDVPSGGWMDEYKTTKLVMRRIPAGTFIMGASPEDFGRMGREIQRQVTLTTDFYIGVFQVTQRQWERVMGDWPSRFDDPAYRDARPVEGVSYNRIRESNREISPNWPQSSEVHPGSFMGRLREKTGLSTLDLPTEAQWEYACRAGTTTELYSGKKITIDRGLCPNLAELGRFRYNHPLELGRNAYNLLRKCTSTDVGTAKVGSYLPNAWGLYDMYGNVWEWCLDWFEGHHSVNHDPVGPASGIARVMRGGNFLSTARRCRSAYRSNGRPNSREGLRLCMTLP